MKGILTCTVRNLNGECCSLSRDITRPRRLRARRKRQPYSAWRMVDWQTWTIKFQQDMPKLIQRVVSHKSKKKQHFQYEGRNSQVVKLPRRLDCPPLWIPSNRQIEWATSVYCLFKPTTQNKIDTTRWNIQAVVETVNYQTRSSQEKNPSSFATLPDIMKWCWNVPEVKSSNYKIRYGVVYLVAWLAYMKAHLCNIALIFDVIRDADKFTRLPKTCK